MIGYDYTARIAPAALKAAGCTVAFRYTMPQTPFWVKALRNAEAEELLAAGIPIVSNFESTANRESGGAQAGHDDAVTLLADWKALGAPSGLIGWFSADWDVQPGDVPAVVAYLRAADAVLKPHGYGTGCYGGLRAVTAAMDAGFGGWQTVAWSNGQWDLRAAARQTGKQLMVGGVQVDENLIINLAALGAWGGPTTGADVQLTDQITFPAYAVKDYPDFGFNSTTVAVADLLAWTAARASHVAAATGPIQDALDQILAKVGTPAMVDVNTLAAQLGPLLHPTTDVDALAAALAPHVGVPDPAAFAAALVSHIEVTSK